MEKAESYLTEFESIRNSAGNDKHALQRAYFELFCQVIEESTASEGIYFNTLFSRLAFAGTKYNLSKSLLYYAHLFRKNIEKNLTTQPIESNIILAESVIPSLIKALHGTPDRIWIEKVKELDEIFRKVDRKIVQFHPVVEALVISVDKKAKTLSFIVEDDPVTEKIAFYDRADSNDIFTRNIELMAEYFRFPVYVNFINTDVTENQEYIPAAFVIHPDYLIDVTAIAECFKPEGASPFYYLISKFKAYEISPNLATGNIVNLFLDELIYNPDIDFEHLMKSVFQTAPVLLSLFSDEDVINMVSDLKKHYKNLRSAIKNDFPNLNISTEFIFTEPSFFSRDYGIQGRLDLLHYDQNDKNIDIVELKSGSVFKPNVYGIGASHFIQTLLYDLLIKSAYRSGIKASCYILYSKSEEKTLRFAPQIKAQQYEAIKVRNQIILMEQQMQSSEMLKKLLTFIKPDNFSNVKGFALKDIEKIYNIFTSLNSIEQSYVLNFASFITREQLLSKTGEQSLSGTFGLAALWLQTIKEKEERFAILHHLMLAENQSNQKEPILIFKRSAEQETLSAFRVGDIAVLYPDTDKENSILHNQIFKCTILQIDNNSVVVRLRSMQQNQVLFEQFNFWTIEEDNLDSSYQAMHRSLFSFGEASPDYRTKFLGLKAPAPSVSKSDLPKYPEMTEEQQQILHKIIQANDYFLLWGPPGTGKTSVMLKYLVKYLFEETTENILLLSYTNRAVDEICESLNSINENFRENFTRVGSRFSTSAAFQNILLDQAASKLKNRNEVLGFIDSKRVFISTVSSISGRADILRLKKFDTIIVDEASQIPEPMLAGLLNRCSKYILIGDHKQLPAVVKQAAQDSRIQDSELLNIGITDTSMSLFERMYNQCQKFNRTDNIGIISMQGRMHQSIMDFPNLNFYQNQLRVLDKSERLISNRLLNSRDKIETLLSNERLLYIPARVDNIFSIKTNIHEANIVCELVEKIYMLLKNNQIELRQDTLGVITPYRAQIALIRKILEKRNQDIYPLITVDTVERYQGGARDIIILSLCSNKISQFSSLISLSEDGTDRKLNVALTRAKEQIIITGNEDILNQNEIYNKLINVCYRMEWGKD